MVHTSLDTQSHVGVIKNDQLDIHEIFKVTVMT